MRIWLALRVLFTNRKAAAEIKKILEASKAAEPAEPSAPAKPAKAAPEPKAPPRSEAITLLATLQREARFVDIVKEPLTNYTDAQIGAAARDVLRDCGAVLDRLFDIRPVVEQAEGSELETPAKIDPAQYRVMGNVQGEAPYRGQLVHHGWKAMRCDLPQWSGSDNAARVVAPVELELK